MQSQITEGPGSWRGAPAEGPMGLMDPWHHGPMGLPGEGGKYVARWAQRAHGVTNLGKKVTNISIKYIIHKYFHQLVLDRSCSLSVGTLLIPY